MAIPRNEPHPGVSVPHGGLDHRQYDTRHAIADALLNIEKLRTLLHASFALVVTSWHRWPLGLRGTVGQRNIAKLSLSHHTAGPQACAA